MNNLTFLKNDEAELFLETILEEIKTGFKDFDSMAIDTLILIGGYGRGEGGVIIENNIGNPHNNLDLLLVHSGHINSKRINNLIQEISTKYDFGIDISFIKKSKLLSLSGLVILYDMRFGHKTIIGNSDFIKNNELFSLENIYAKDITSLMINRGSLMLINRLLLKKLTKLTNDENRLIIKHTIKAIIGFGDALLYVNDSYNWSYKQKQINMKKLDLGELNNFKEIYNDALNFRFNPNYEEYLKINLTEWNEQLMSIFSSIHFIVESNRLGKKVLFKNYLSVALSKSDPVGMKGLLKGMKFSLTRPLTFLHLSSTREAIGFFTSDGKDMLTIIYPYIAYENYPKRYFNMIRSILGYDCLLHNYLALWGKYGDTNFINVLNKYDLGDF